jgi:hypothetical protein
LSADQVTAEDEEKIDPDPAEAIDAAGQFESEKRGVINDDDDDGESAEKIEPRLAFTIGEARVNCSLDSWFLNGGKRSRRSLAVEQTRSPRTRMSILQ